MVTPNTEEKNVKLHSQQIEQRFYEFLGVKLFRVLVFKLEKAIHRRDKRKNINYHIASYEPQSVDKFIKYLFYNGAIHVRNIIMLLAFFAIRYGLYRAVSPFDIIPLLFFLKDCYCVMLQRYNYLRIKTRLARLQEKRDLRIKRKASQITAMLSYDEEETRQQDLLFVQQMIRNIQEGQSIVLSESETETLYRLKAIMDKTVVEHQAKTRQEQNNEDDYQDS